MTACSTPATVVATHVRSLHKGTEDLVLDHYLEVLARKPGALAGATALAAARASGCVHPAHQRFWDAARRALGDGPGTRALIGVLLLHRTLPAAAVAAGHGRGGRRRAASTPDLVAVEARRPPRHRRRRPQRRSRCRRSAGRRRRDDRPAPSLAGYDQLLTGATA